MRTVLFLIRKEYLQIFRDRATVFQILFIPVVQLLVLSNAATFEVKNTRMHVVDLDRSRTSRELVGEFVASGRFQAVAHSASMEAADEDLLSRKASMVLHIPRDFERDLVRNGTGKVQLLLNAEEGAAAAITRASATRILMDYGSEKAAELRADVRGVRGRDRTPPRPREGGMEVRLRGWFNPMLTYYDYMVPGILAFLVTLVGTLLAAQNIAREKELGTLEQLNVTPISRGQFIAGKLIPFWILALVDFAIGLVLARHVFGVPVRGSLFLVFGATALYLVVALGIGLWISTVAETQQQAMFLSFFVLVIYVLMSGLFTPTDSMPAWARWLAEVNPVKHFIIVMRAVLVRGADLADVQAPLLALALSAPAVLALAVRRYSKTSR